MESKAELFKALALAQGEIENATKNASNPHFKSKYADLAECINATKEPLARHGLCVIQLINKIEGGIELETILGHSSGQSISSHTPLLFSNNNMQQMGSAISYARRYSLSAITGLAQEDDDGNSVQDKNGFKKLEEKIEKPKLKNFAEGVGQSVEAEVDPENYIFQKGSAFAGKKMGEVPIEEIENYYHRMQEWLSSGNTPTAQSIRMINNMERHLKMMGKL